MVKALRQDPMHSPHIYRHGFQAALPFGACRPTTVTPGSVPRFSSHLLSFSGSARNAELPLFYHNQIESVSRFLFHVELATPSKSQHRKHLLGEGFRTPRRPRPPSARSLGQAKGGGGGWRQHTGLGMHFASLLFSLLPGFPPFLALPPRRPSSGLRRAAMATPKGQARPPSPARRGPAARRTPGSSPRPFCPSFVAEIPLSGAIPSRPPAPRPRP